MRCKFEIGGTRSRDTRMSYEEETEYATASFRCVDPVQNFKIRVVLQPVKNRFIPTPNLESDRPPDTPGSPIQNEDVETEGSEEYTFSWQEKLFSKSEIVMYSNLANCKSKLHEKYHEEVLKTSNSLNDKNRKLFSYVDIDNYKVNDTDINPVHGSKGYISHLAKQINSMEISCSSIKTYKNISKHRIVNYSPNDNFKNHNHLISTSSQKMYIMADLSDEERGDSKKNNKKNEEYILCVITYDPTCKVIKMSPTFSKEVDNKPYYIGSNGQYSRNAYHYWLHHASQRPSQENLSNEKRIRNKILQHQSEVRKLQIGTEFSGQSPNHIHVTIFGEIVTAEDFEHDSFIIHYAVNMPPGWRCISPETLMGMTHIARSNDLGIAHFCHLFNLELLFDLKHLEDFSAYLPEIYFEVLSIDTWKIYRNEGYAYLTLPRKPGVHNFTLKCWRALGGSVREDLERFFLGGSQVLEDVSYAGTGCRDDNKRIMSRFGFKTVPSGVLNVKLNVLHQSELFKSEKDKKSEMERNIFGRLETSNLLGSVNAVLEAFRQARERMLKAKETLDAQ